MKAVAADSPILADTPHARLLVEYLKTGGFMEWQTEHIIEAIIVLRKSTNQEQRLEAMYKIVRAANDLAKVYTTAITRLEAS